MQGSICYPKVVLSSVWLYINKTQKGHILESKGVPGMLCMAGRTPSSLPKREASAGYREVRCTSQWCSATCFMLVLLRGSGTLCKFVKLKCILNLEGALWRDSIRGSFRAGRNNKLFVTFKCTGFVLLPTFPSLTYDHITAYMGKVYPTTACSHIPTTSWLNSPGVACSDAIYKRKNRRKLLKWNKSVILYLKRKHHHITLLVFPKPVFYTCGLAGRVIREKKQNHQ